MIVELSIQLAGEMIQAVYGKALRQSFYIMNKLKACRVRISSTVVNQMPNFFYLKRKFGGKLLCAFTIFEEKWRKRKSDGFPRLENPGLFPCQAVPWGENPINRLSDPV